jgi:hypothetical protein
MPYWLVEDPSVVCILLTTVAVVLAASWWRTRKRHLAIGAAVAAGLIGLVVLLDQWIVTDYEQLVLNLNAMAEAAGRRDLDAIFEHISNDFRHGGMNKTVFRQKADDAVRRHGVEQIILWDFRPVKVSSKSRTATVEFLAKARAGWSKGEYYLCRAEFVLEEPGRQWRMKGFELFNPYSDSNQAIPIPGI